MAKRRKNIHYEFAEGTRYRDSAVALSSETQESLFTPTLILRYLASHPLFPPRGTADLASFPLFPPRAGDRKWLKRENSPPREHLEGATSRITHLEKIGKFFSSWLFVIHLYLPQS